MSAPAREIKQTVFVLRHGDRYDFSVGSDAWAKIAKRLHDPPLSHDIGAAQQMDLYKYFSGLKMDEPDLRVGRVFTSPFLRCIQTSNPIAQAYDVPLLVEDSLWEVVFTDEIMPTLDERSCYFPRIDTDYKSCFKPEPKEDFPAGALERYGRAAFELEARYLNQGDASDEAIAICTHAAGVVTLVSALLKTPVAATNAALPCGIYRLEREGLGDTSKPWKIHRMCGHQDVLTGTCDAKGSMTSYLELTKLMLAGKESKTQAWPVASSTLTDEEKAQSVYSVAYPTWADKFLESSEMATWLTVDG